MKTRVWRLLAAAVLAVMLLSACGETAQPAPTARRVTRSSVPAPVAPGNVTLGNEFAGVDASCTGDGYIVASYAGAAAKAKLQLTLPDGLVYTYTLTPGREAVLPLTGGAGEYGVKMLENAFDDFYAMVFSGSFPAEGVDEFLPYLYPNQFVRFTSGDSVCTLGAELSGESADDLDYVTRVYTYVVENITYDHDLASSPPTDYLPDPVSTLASGKGICLDYASLMTALLRCQGIPTRLVVGYSGSEYHAWISVYLEQIGWMDGIIYFDGTSWSRIDPTLGAGNRKSSVKDYVNNSGNYLEKYFY